MKVQPSCKLALFLVLTLFAFTAKPPETVRAQDFDLEQLKLAPGIVRQHTYRAAARTMDVDVTEDALTNLPSWHTREDSPPIKPAEALAIALDVRKRLYEDRLLSDENNTWKETDWEISSVQLHPVSLEEGTWYWLVQFETMDEWSGPPNQFGVAVLMNGKSIAPKPRDR